MQKVAASCSFTLECPCSDGPSYATSDKISSKHGWNVVYQYHVIFDFLKHVIVGHDEVLGCVTISNVGQDTQRLTKFKIRLLHKWCLAVNQTESKAERSQQSTTKWVHLFFDLYAMIGLQNQRYRLHNLLAMRTHDLVDMLQTHHITSHHKRKFQCFQVIKKMMQKHR